MRGPQCSRTRSSRKERSRPLTRWNCFPARWEWAAARSSENIPRQRPRSRTRLGGRGDDVLDELLGERLVCRSIPALAHAGQRLGAALGHPDAIRMEAPLRLRLPAPEACSWKFHVTRGVRSA